ncbi:MAG: DnaT-like ssDNA-binding protein [Armatimonadota bacterium]
MTVVATIAGTASNSYLSLEEAGAYFAARLHADAWDAASDADREKAMLTACRRIEAHRLQVHRRPYGFAYDLPNALDRLADPLAPADPDQALSFPRQRDLDRTGSFAIPEPVKQAQCEEALALLAQGAEQERRRFLQAAGVKSFAVDGLSETYESGAAAQMLFSAEARMLLAPFVDRCGVIATSDSPDGEWSPGSAR